jgi:RNA polymerase sigma factor (sigma-70 family)
LNSEQRFLEQLPLIDRVVRFVCVRYGLRGADAEDFASAFRLKLIENDYAAFLSYEGRSSLETYLATVAQHLYFDQRHHTHGKWRPSTAAKRIGDQAVLLEQLLHRDRRNFEEATASVREHFPELSVSDIAALREHLPMRPPRRRGDTVSEEELEQCPSGTSAEDEALRKERENNARRVGDILQREIARLDPEDRLILKMHYFDAFKVSVIARTLNLNQKRLYDRIHRLENSLRAALTDDLGRGEISDLIVYGCEALDLRLDDTEAPGDGGRPDQQRDKAR